MKFLMENWGLILTLVLGVLGWRWKEKSERLQGEIDEAKAKELLKDVDLSSAEAKKVADEAAKNLAELVGGARDASAKYRSGKDNL